MLRTSFRDEQYFTGKLNLLGEDYSRLINDYNALKTKKGEGYPGHQTIEFMISDNLLLQIKAKYTRGDSVPELKPLFLDALHYFILSWDDSVAYTDVLVYVSLCVLLDVGRDETLKLYTLLESENYQDHNLYFLVRHVLPDIAVPENLKWKGKPDQLLKQLTNSDHVSAVGLLKEYLQKFWYPQFRSEPWYNSHKPENKNNQAYLGYWCFESGATVKVMGLDDGVLKGHPYYPYDLVQQ